MNCLCCNKPIPPTASPKEIQSRWHSKCVKNFFGVTALPSIDISEEALEALAVETIGKGFTIPGVQKKLSLHLTEEHAPRLTLVNYPTGYILKPQTKDYERLPEAEYLIMLMAQKSGINTVPFALINMNDELAYITKRIDRISAKPVQPLAMEDFCQLDERLTQDKYKGSYERCAKIISKYSVRSGFDLSELFLRLVFSFAVGNSDMHLKNFSLIETKPNSCEYILSEAYDLLPVNAVLPEDTEQFALTINGKKNKIQKKDFIIFADSIGIPQKSAEKIIKNIASKKDEFLAMCDDSYLSPKMKATLKEIIVARISALT